MKPKFLNLLPWEDTPFWQRPKPRKYLLIALSSAMLSMGGFELYLKHLSSVETSLENTANSLADIKTNIQQQENLFNGQQELSNTIQNDTFPMYSFLSSLSTDISNDMWLYKITSDDFQYLIETPRLEAEQQAQQAGQTGSSQTTTQTTQTTQGTGQQQKTTGTTSAPTNYANGTTNNTANANAANQKSPVKKASLIQKKTYYIKGAGTSSADIGAFVMKLNNKPYIRSATLDSVEEYIAHDQVYEAFEIKVVAK